MPDAGLRCKIRNLETLAVQSANETEKTVRKAAQYVRMSTEHQRYSTENQSAAIAKYAEERGYKIVRTYSDAGKSGLRIQGRDGLSEMLRDIEQGETNYQTVLVYDVSRWGRFQDADESAYYEFLCRKAGIAVEYCAEQFENDGSLMSTLAKTLKRTMAGEYSRELSKKVFAGQARLIELGFRQGGAPGFGLRRMLVDEDGVQKGLLNRGEHKSIQTDRVILVPGPPNEVAIVRQIFELFVSDRKSEAEICAILNNQGVLTDLGRSWSSGVVRQILTNEKYIGNNVWNRNSFKLKQNHVRNLPEQWVRAVGVFDAIVPIQQFEAAAEIIAARSQKLTDQEMLDGLRKALQSNGFLSGVIIDETKALPSSSAYQSRFGSLLRAYQLVGYTPARDYRYININKRLRSLHSDIVGSVTRGIAEAGGKIDDSQGLDRLVINNEFTASIVVARCQQTTAGSLRWKLRLGVGQLPDLTIVVRMNQSNDAPLDYYILPTVDMRETKLNLAENNGLSLDAYRHLDLHSFFLMTARTPLKDVA